MPADISKINPRRRAKICALCPANMSLTVSGSWYLISPKKMIVRTPIVLPIFKPSSHQCCAKCYMKNRRTYEKQTTTKQRQHAIPHAFINKFTLSNESQNTNSIPFDMNALIREKVNIENSLTETTMLQNTLALHITPLLNPLLSYEDLHLVQSFTREIREYSKLLQQLKALANKLISSKGSVLSHDCVLYSTTTLQVKQQLIKLTQVFVAFSSKPSFQPLLLKLLACFQSRVNPSLDNITHSPKLQQPLNLTAETLQLPSYSEFPSYSSSEFLTRRQEGLPHFSTLISEMNSSTMKTTSRLNELANIASIVAI